MSVFLTTEKAIPPCRGAKHNPGQPVILETPFLKDTVGVSPSLHSTCRSCNPVWCSGGLSHP